MNYFDWSNVILPLMIGQSAVSFVFLRNWLVRSKLNAQSDWLKRRCIKKTKTAPRSDEEFRSSGPAAVSWYLCASKKWRSVIMDRLLQPTNQFSCNTTHHIKTITTTHLIIGSTTGKTFGFKSCWKVVQPIGNDVPISGKKNNISKLNQYLKVRTFLILNDLEKNSLFLIKMCVKECEGICFGSQWWFQPGEGRVAMLTPIHLRLSLKVFDHTFSNTSWLTHWVYSLGCYLVVLPDELNTDILR